MHESCRIGVSLERHVTSSQQRVVLCGPDQNKFTKNATKQKPYLQKKKPRKSECGENSYT